MEKQVMLIDADVSLAEQLEQRDQTCFEGGGVAFEQYLSLPIHLCALILSRVLKK